MDSTYKVSGWWRVSTEGDVEGRSTVELGVWRGHPADIAYILKDNVGSWSLSFEPVSREVANRLEARRTCRRRVSISVGLMNKSEVLQFLQSEQPKLAASMEESTLWGCVDVAWLPE